MLGICLGCHPDARVGSSSASRSAAPECAPRRKTRESVFALCAVLASFASRSKRFLRLTNCLSSRMSAPHASSAASRRRTLSSNSRRGLTSSWERQVCVRAERRAIPFSQNVFASPPSGAASAFLPRASAGRLIKCIDTAKRAAKKRKAAQRPSRVCNLNANSSPPPSEPRPAPEFESVAPSSEKRETTEAFQGADSAASCAEGARGECSERKESGSAACAERSPLDSLRVLVLDEADFLLGRLLKEQTA